MATWTDESGAEHEYLAPAASATSKDDPAMAALKRSTQSLRDVVQAMQNNDLVARQAMAEDARRTLDSTLFLTSGTGLNGRSMRTEDEASTLLQRVPVRPASSASKASAANPYVSQAQGPAPLLTAGTVLAQAGEIKTNTSVTSGSSGSSGSSGRATLLLR